MHPNGHQLTRYLMIGLTLALISLHAQAAVTTGFRGGILDITGTPGSDIILVYSDGNQVNLLAIDGTGVITQKNWPPVRVGRVEVKAGAGNDLVYTAGLLWGDSEGEDGRDLLIATDRANFTYNGGKHNDIIIEATSRGARLYGGDDSDLLLSDRGSEWHSGGDGPDMMFAGRGDDDFWGADRGNDYLLGGDGDDDIEGEQDQDVLFGMNGNDTMKGSGGHDVLFGGPGLDRMNGNDGNDVLCGWLDHDELFGDAGNDWLYGEQGADDHDGGAGNNELFGNAALGDTFVAGRINPDALCGEKPAIEAIQPMIETGIYDHEDYILVIASEHNDSINISANSEGVQVDVQTNTKDSKPKSRFIAGSTLKSLAVMSGAGDDKIKITGTFDRIALIGDNGADTLDLSQASAEQNALIGGAGDDRLIAGNKLTFIRSGDGNDSITAGSGRDIIIAGNNDQITSHTEQDIIITTTMTDVEDQTEPQPATSENKAALIIISLLVGVLIGIGIVLSRRRG